MPRKKTIGIHFYSFPHEQESCYASPNAGGFW
jgi:hypothetical protein